MLDSSLLHHRHQIPQMRGCVLEGSHTPGESVTVVLFNTLPGRLYLSAMCILISRYQSKLFIIASLTRRAFISERTSQLR